MNPAYLWNRLLNNIVNNKIMTKTEKEQLLKDFLASVKMYIDYAEIDNNLVTLVFKQGYVNYSYHAKKKIILYAIRIFDATDLDVIKISIPAKDDNGIMQMYSMEIDRYNLFARLEENLVHTDITDETQKYMHKKTIEAVAKICINVETIAL